MKDIKFNEHFLKKKLELDFDLPRKKKEVSSKASPKEQLKKKMTQKKMDFPFGKAGKSVTNQKPV